MNHVKPPAGAYEIDSEIAEKYPCVKCGGKCRYDSHVTDETYRAFSVCTKCGHIEEF